MAVDRALFTELITRYKASNWHCPRCAGGYLRLVNGSISSDQTAESAATVRGEGREPEWFESRFTATLKCDNPACMEPVTVSGIGGIDEGPDANRQYVEWSDAFVPKHVSPSPRLISLPSQCPKRVRSELELAFVASWGNFSSAGNHIRSAIENLLDALGVPRTRLSKNGKRIRLNLKTRIDEITAKYPNLVDPLHAIRIIGNDGSHGNALTRDQVFDALDIMEASLNELYGNKKALAQMVKKLLRKK